MIIKGGIVIGHTIKSQEWFEEKVRNYHGKKVDILSKYNGGEKPIDIVYHCSVHGDTYKTINAKNICKPFFLPCKQCQSIRKSQSAKKTNKKDKQFYYNRLVEYCRKRGGRVLEKEWTRAKDQYHFKCGNPEHPVFITTADALYSGEHWCPYCSGRSGNFQKELNELCKERNGELISDYKASGEYVTVRCKLHDYVWDILPGNIKKGRWCPLCSMGFNEKTVYDYLINMKCNFQIQYSFEDLIGVNNEKLRFDFAILDSNNSLICLIEIDDEEHRYNHSGSSVRSIQRREAIERDIKKNEYCDKNNILIYRMQVPFVNYRKWSYQDYYRYINTELKEFVNLARSKEC